MKFITKENFKRINTEIQRLKEEVDGFIEEANTIRHEFKEGRVTPENAVEKVEKIKTYEANAHENRVKISTLFWAQGLIEKANFQPTPQEEKEEFEVEQDLLEKLSKKAETSLLGMTESGKEKVGTIYFALIEAYRSSGVDLDPVIVRGLFIEAVDIVKNKL